jgi:Protein of unknown function (DUF3795)
MVEMIAYCGLDCSKCRAYMATMEKDQELVDDVAKLWSKGINGVYTASDIWCEGCKSDRLHSFCAKCQSRLCAKERKLDYCVLCEDYPCGKLDALYNSWIESSPMKAKANLAFVSQSLKKQKGDTT